MSVATHLEMFAPPQPRMMVLARPNPCHDNLARIVPGKGPHAGGLRCAKCGKWRGWVAAAALKELKPAPKKAAQLGGGARPHEGFFSDPIPFAPEWRG
jgi:hypothetical protein